MSPENSDRDECERTIGNRKLTLILFSSAALSGQVEDAAGEHSKVRVLEHV